MFRTKTRGCQRLQWRSSSFDSLFTNTEYSWLYALIEENEANNPPTSDNKHTCSLICACHLAPQTSHLLHFLVEKCCHLSSLLWALHLFPFHPAMTWTECGNDWSLLYSTSLGSLLLIPEAQPACLLQTLAFKAQMTNKENIQTPLSLKIYSRQLVSATVKPFPI